jgi:uncharacterized membrane protein (UPF0127 family)
MFPTITGARRVSSFISCRSVRASGIAVAVLAGLLALAPVLTASAPAHAQAAPAAATEALAVVTASGQRHPFQVEVMRNDEQRAKGLMFRRFMPADRGMLFDFQRVAPVSMWMQNTYIPLDMLFIRADGTVARIEEHTEPLSTRTIPSGEPVLGVLEINAGVSAQLGIKAGDRIEHPMFRR